MNLVVGATGMLGSEICRQLTSRGHATRALIRGSSNPERIAQLKDFGAELVTGDLKDPSSLQTACRGITTIISTASSTLSRQEGDSIESVDRKGQLDLIAAAEAAGVTHFVLISFPTVDIDFPLQRAKRTVEDRLRRSGMSFTILQPTFFMEVWLGPALGFDAVNATAQVYGIGSNKISWISLQDVAACALAALNNPRATDRTIKLGGPDALSPLEVVGIAESLVGKPIAVQHVPDQALRDQLAAASDPLQKSFAGLMLYYARGDVIDMTEARSVLGELSLKSVRDYFHSSLGVAAG